MTFDTVHRKVTLGPADDAMCKVTLVLIPVSLLGLPMMHVLVHRKVTLGPADDAMCKVTLVVIPVSLLGLPMMHVLVVTHLFGCVEIEIIALFLSWHEGD